jgi:CubicO group peptidase (beta-lactamase class C family)
MQFATQIDQMLAQQVNSQQFSGSVLVAQAGQIILEKGYSMANWSNQTPNTPDTRFFLGSVTKEFTAMSILILQEEGKLQIKNLLCTYVPNCPAPWQAITVQEVLIHTSGIPQLDTSDLSGASPAAWIASFDNAPLEFAAGTEFDYCSICYEVLAYVVQQVSQVPFDQFVQQMILTPLNMTETGFDPNAYYASPTGAIGYANWQSSAEQLGWGLGSQWDFLNGSGLLYSSVKDLYLWDQALYTSKLLPQQVLQQAFTPYTTADLFPGSQYGYGWFISKAPVPGHTLIWHDGVIDGFRNFIGRYINDDVTIIIQSNLASIDVVGLSHKIEQIIFGGTSSN